MKYYITHASCLVLADLVRDVPRLKYAWICVWKGTPPLWTVQPTWREALRAD